MTEQALFDKLKYRITIDEDGNKRYFDCDGEYHRDEGPAIEYANGSKSWFINGKRHRIDGPACEWSTGPRWYIDDKQLTEKEFNEYRRRNV